MHLMPIFTLYSLSKQKGEKKETKAIRDRTNAENEAETKGMSNMLNTKEE